MRPSVLYQSASARVVAGVALGIAALPAAAQDLPQEDARELPAVSVEGQQSLRNGSDVKVDNPSLPKLTEPLRNTPQSIDIVPKQMIDDRGAQNLNDALRTVPGVSLAAGEGGSQGTSLTIRGFTARNDIFLDGMRDFGSYYRDPFAMEAVEVLKGPASMLFGRGSTGGIVNQVGKAPELHGFTAGTITFGTDNTKRITTDIDAPVEAIPGAAVRLAAMAYESNVAGRDEAEFARWGVAPAVSFGLGTATRTTFSYFHQGEDNVPDYGFPRYFTGLPPIPPVSPNNYYGFTNDYLRTSADVATAKIEHDVNAWLTVRDQLRYAYYHRTNRITEPQIPASVTQATPIQTIQVTRNLLTGEATDTFLQNQADGIANFETWGLKHTTVGGIEIGRETSDPTRFGFNSVPTANLVAPPHIEFNDPPSVVTSNIHSKAHTYAAYVFDTMKIGEQWEVSSGGRYDRFAVDVDNAITQQLLGQTDNLLSWRAGLVYKPIPIGSVYFGWGTSFQPSAEAFALAPSTVNVKPEKSESYEVGTKWDVLYERLSLRGAVFILKKTDLRVVDPNNSQQQILGGSQQVNGFELEANGRITDKLQLFAGYAYQDGRTTKAPPGGTPVEGAPLVNSPLHTFHLWSTYDLPHGFQVGGGVNYVSDRIARNISPYVTVDDYVTIDAMVKYSFTDNVEFQLNGINLTDKFYIDLPHPNHLIPGAGRTFLFSTAFKF